MAFKISQTWLYAGAVAFVGVGGYYAWKYGLLGGPPPNVPNISLSLVCIDPLVNHLVQWSATATLNGTPLSGILVTIVNEAGATVSSGVTNAQGVAGLLFVGTGAHIYVATYNGVFSNTATLSC